MYIALKDVMRQIAALFFVFSVICGIVFVTTGFSLIWMLATAIWLIGAFMAFAISFVA